MDIASSACAIQNLWLAARAEGLGMGWVSIFDPLALARLLQMPEGTRWACSAWALSMPTTPSPCCSRKMGLPRPLEDMLMDDVWDDSRVVAAATKGKPGSGPCADKGKTDA
jgi:5,6-dimethylbenzimidazole synthase